MPASEVKGDPVASRRRDLERIRGALEAARAALAAFTPGEIEHRRKSGGDPVTEADVTVDRLLREELLEADEGWLSEETRDDSTRLQRRRVWVVDPLDGTREFVQGIPEWCVSIALVEEGEAVAGGILNPAADLLVLGARETGVTANGAPAAVTAVTSLEAATVLASRSEVGRGEWERFRGREFRIVAMGSVAWKMARVAAGLADATWTLVPKNEWDVAAGTALVRAAGGEVHTPAGDAPRFNRGDTLLPGLIAHGPGLAASVRETIEAVERAPGA